MMTFIVKGLLRDRSRSFFPVLTVSAGTFLSVFLSCWLQGAMGEMVSTTARFEHGHVKIVTREYGRYASQMPNDLCLIGVEKYLRELEGSYGDMLWTPRIHFGGLLDVPDEKGETRAQGPVMGLGVDLTSPHSPEPSLLNLKQALKSGALPSKPGEILISHDFAEKLAIKPGDEVTLIGATMHGSMAFHNFTLSGTVVFGIAPMDRGAMIADLSEVQKALDMSDGAGEIVGYTKDMLYHRSEMERLVVAFNAGHNRSDDPFSPVMRSLREQPGMAEYTDVAGKVGSYIVVVFVLVMAIVLWNSGLLNGIRRYGEMGLRLALGETKSDLYLLIIGESAITGFAGSCIGTALGLAASYYLQYKGFDIGEYLRNSTILMTNVIRAQVTPASFFIGFLPGLGAPLAGAIFAGIGIFKRDMSQLFKELES